MREAILRRHVYPWRGPKSIDKATRERLAVLAARHDIRIESCVDECIESFGKGLSFEDSLTCLDEVPAVLRERKKSMASLRSKVVEVLADEIVELLEQICAEEHGNGEGEEGDEGEEKEEEGDVEGEEEEDVAGTEGEEEEDD